MVRSDVQCDRGVRNVRVGIEHCIGRVKEYGAARTLDVSNCCRVMCLFGINGSRRLNYTFIVIGPGYGLACESRKIS